jgi:hypothetical protein
MAQTYYVCHNYALEDVVLQSLSARTTCSHYTTNTVGGVTTVIYHQTWRITLDAASSEDFTAYYTYTRAETLDDGYNYSYNVYTNQSSSVLIPAGVTYKDIVVDCRTYSYAGSGRDDYWSREDEIYDLALAAQPQVPTCEPPPVECTVDIVSYSVTNPSRRGESDGSISVVASGCTGSTLTWKLNGVTDSGTNITGHTFTGLTAGNYYVYISEGVCWSQSAAIVVQEGEFRTGDFVANDMAEMQATENPIILQLQTAVNSFTPEYSKSAILITGGTISGVTISFELVFPIVYNAEFISKGYPDRSTYFLESVLKNEIGIPAGTNTNTEIATSLAECLQNDSILSRYYYITNSGTTITLTAKEYGVNFDLDSSNVTISGTGVTITSITSGIAQYDGQLAANYSLYTELFVNTDLQYGDTPDMTTYRRVAELELPFNKTNLHKFDLAPVLKNFVSSPKIDFTFTGFTTLPSMDTTYFCKYGEKYPLIENTNTKKKRYKGVTDVKYAINSALNFESPNDMSAYLGQPVTTGSTTYSGITFMNTAPNPKYIARGSKEFLYFILKQGYPNALALKGDIYFYNGTSQTGETFITISTLTGATNFGGVTMLACGYDELGLAAYENSGNTKIRRVDFAVWQTTPSAVTTQLTETRSYLLEIDEQPQKYDVAFLNKLGTYETYSFVGEVVEDQEVERETIQKPYSVSATGAAPLGFEYNSIYGTKYTKLITVNSGTVDEDTYYYLMQLLQSNKIYNYSNVHENFLTVVSQTAQKSTNASEYTVQVQFRETIEENNVAQ